VGGGGAQGGERQRRSLSWVEVKGSGWQRWQGSTRQFIARVACASAGCVCCSACLLASGTSALTQPPHPQTVAVLAPGSVLPPGRRIPSGQLWAGSPAKYVRDLTKDEVGPGYKEGGGLAVVCRPSNSLQNTALGWQLEAPLCISAAACPPDSVRPCPRESPACALCCGPLTPRPAHLVTTPAEGRDCESGPGNVCSH
jgi:hypothetical protein